MRRPLMRTGLIYNISRMRMSTDGPGMTTLIAFKDCPLNCVYCLNEKCHKPRNGEVDLAPAASYKADELIAEWEKDGMYLSMTGGGVVFGGGEPLLQADFIRDVCEKISEPWEKRIETSLNVYWEQINKLTKHIDFWIVDIKDLNSKIYGKYTGRSNRDVVENLYKLVNAVGCDKVHIRVPKIPNFNTDEDVEKSVNYIRTKLCIEPEVFTYTVDKNRDATPRSYYWMGMDYCRDYESCKKFLNAILPDKANFLANTSEYLKKDSNVERISRPEEAYRMLFAEMYVFAKTKGYECSESEIQEIIDEYISEIEDVDNDPMLGYSMRIHIKERIRAMFSRMT